MHTIKDTDFLLIQGWMVNKLNLKGNDLLLYSIIYDLSRDEHEGFYGNLQYLADWTNSTKQGVIRSLNSLINKNLITKSTTVIDGFKRNVYIANKFN